MKIREGFVSNSSSSSFILICNEDVKLDMPNAELFMQPSDIVGLLEAGKANRSFRNSDEPSIVRYNGYDKPLKWFRRAFMSDRCQSLFEIEDDKRKQEVIKGNRKQIAKMNSIIKKANGKVILWIAFSHQDFFLGMDAGRIARVIYGLEKIGVIKIAEANQS